jgi:hypothetical protein
MSLKDEFIRIKHKIQKQYPGASVKRDRFGKFYIVDGNGYKILQDEFEVPNTDTCLEAWVNSSVMVWYKHIIETNNQKFNDEKIFKFLTRDKDKEFTFKD